MPTVASGRRTLGLHVDALAGGDWRFEALYSRTRNMRTSLTRASRTQHHAMQLLSVKPSTGAGAEAGRRCDEQLGSLGDVCEQPVQLDRRNSLKPPMCFFASPRLLGSRALIRRTQMDTWAASGL
ncbi:hypothetical protein GQ55_2G122100 [Panicum hallii var. hallii]|uniref:Uncharacterized protein n=1 Tax=Panicum hallii var. hallii TaxID=1504633 RepID=A0A2T7EP40_9POAL|nr:hypothetical protein GQ55_2G122100 [Panicum hallii var. hallii]